MSKSQRTTGCCPSGCLDMRTLILSFSYVWTCTDSVPSVSPACRRFSFPWFAQEEERSGQIKNSRILFYFITPSASWLRRTVDTRQAPDRRSTTAPCHGNTSTCMNEGMRRRLLTEPTCRSTRVLVSVLGSSDQLRLQ